MPEYMAAMKGLIAFEKPKKNPKKGASADLGQGEVNHLKELLKKGKEKDERI